MFKLNAIWKQEELKQHIQNSYNAIIVLDPTQPKLTDTEAWSIQMLLYQYCHTLRRCYCKYDDSQQDEAFSDLKDIISHNIIQLVNEVKMLVKTCNLDKLGHTHNKTNTRPYNNDASDVDNTIIDNVSYTDINSLSSLVEFVKDNSTYLKLIYNEIESIVVMIYEV